MCVSGKLDDVGIGNMDNIYPLCTFYMELQMYPSKEEK